MGRVGLKGGDHSTLAIHSSAPATVAWGSLLSTCWSGRSGPVRRRPSRSA